MPKGSTEPIESAMSDEHKAALVVGRSEARAVREYLAALRHHRPRPGRKRTRQSVKRRLDAVENELATADHDEEDPIRILELIQERIDLVAELETMSTVNELAQHEQEFVRVASAFGERKGITYQAWREMGIPPAVLRRAGIRSGSA
jgi:hypothetical protein